MHRMLLPVVAAGAAAAAVAVPALGASSPSHAVGRTLQLDVREVWHGPPPATNPSCPGAVYPFQSAVRDAHGRRVGTADGYAVNLRPPFVAWHATARLRRGDLVVEGVLDLSGRTPQVLAIAGGSGAFAGAAGSASLRDDGAGGDRVTLRFTER
jgi:hypothetical protein